MIDLTQSTAVELAEHRIRVDAVCPGAVHTELMHRGRPEVSDGRREQLQTRPERGEPEMIADVATWLASDEARFVTGTTVTADGGTMAATPTGRPRSRPPSPNDGNRLRQHGPGPRGAASLMLRTRRPGG